MRLLVAAGVVLATATLAGCGATSTAPTLPAGRYLTTSRLLTPGVHAFGDTVTARVDAVVDRDHIDPARLRLKTAFAPYTAVGVGAGDVERRDFGHFSHLRWELQLRCLRYSCLTKRLSTALNPDAGGNRLFHFPPARLLYDDPTSGKARQLRRLWFPPLVSVSRIDATNPQTTYGFPFTASTIPLPAVSAWISAPLLAVLLLLAALALLALPAVLGVRWLLARRQPEVEPEPETTPLEHALRLVEWSVGQGEEQRREALEVLAVELEDVGMNGLGEAARALAWPTGAPQPDAIGRFLSTLREADGGPV